MAQTTNQDEDLLILSDDADSISDLTPGDNKENNAETTEDVIISS
jgi:hypothetical protein